MTNFGASLHLPQDAESHRRSCLTSGNARHTTAQSTSQNLPHDSAVGAWPFADLTPLKYSVILCDPPWRFTNYSAKGEAKNPNQHYACMSLADIKALPVSQLAAPDCALIMWCTSPLLDQQIDVLKAWGFTYKAAGAWGKQSKTGNALAFGGGYILRSAAEFFIVGTIGAPKRQSRSIRNLIMAPVREHSRKPDALHDMVEALYEGPYCELFARASRPGWDVWGNQTTKFDEEVVNA